MALAFVFPGQGAQAVGMGRDVAQAYPQAQAVWDEVDAALGEKLSALVWEGDADELTLTRNAQPALMATSLAVVRALAAEGVAVGRASLVAGHSLGEYSALAATGALTITDAARLLRTRGTAMQGAVPSGEGAMAAILGLDLDTVRAIASEAAADEVCAAANDNDPAQVVVSGHKAAVERAAELARGRGAKRALMLPVSAPFHCKLMAPAAEVMADALGVTEMSAPSVPLVANVTAAPVVDPGEIRALLIDQVTGMVRWRESVEAMVGGGVTRFAELGAGRALSGMIRRIDRSAETMAAGGPDEVRALAAALG